MDSQITSNRPVMWYPVMDDAEGKKRADIIRRAVRSGMKKKDIAAQIGVTPMQIGRYSRGENRPGETHWGRIDRLGRQLGVECAEEAAPYHVAPSLPETIRNSPSLREALLDAMTERDWSFGQLARAASNSSPTTVRRLLVDGDIDFFPLMLADLARAMNVDMETLPIEPDEKHALQAVLPALRHGTQMRDIPVVAAANAAELSVVNGILEFDDWDAAEKIPNPTDGRRCVGFRVHGRSMFPTLDEGDTVVVDCDLDPTPGKVAVVILEDDSILVKVWRPLGSDRVLLQSLNTNGEDREVALSEIRWAKRAIRKEGML